MKIHIEYVVAIVIVITAALPLHTSPVTHSGVMTGAIMREQTTYTSPRLINDRIPRREWYDTACSWY